MRRSTSAVPALMPAILTNLSGMGVDRAPEQNSIGFIRRTVIDTGAVIVHGTLFGKPKVQPLT